MEWEYEYSEGGRSTKVFGCGRRRGVVLSGE